MASNKELSSVLALIKEHAPVVYALVTGVYKAPDYSPAFRVNDEILVAKAGEPTHGHLAARLKMEGKAVDYAGAGFVNKGGLFCTVSEMVTR